MPSGLTRAQQEHSNKRREVCSAFVVLPPTTHLRQLIHMFSRVSSIRCSLLRSTTRSQLTVAKLPFRTLAINRFSSLTANRSAKPALIPSLTRSMATASQHEHPPQPSPQHFMNTSGATDPVWVHQDPYSNRPHFSHLDQELETDIVIVGSGISGVSCAYELVGRGKNVIMLEAREILSGETSRTSGHLASALDDGYTNIAQKHGDSGAIIAAESHNWAIDHVGEVAKKLGIACEYRLLPGIEVSQYDRNKQPKEHESEIKELKEEVAKCKGIGMDVDFKEGYVVKGWDGQPDQRDAAIFQHQATFHPTKYLNGILKWLKEQPNFKCFSHTRVMDTPEKGIEIGPIGRKTVQVKTDRGHTVTCGDVIVATCVPLQKLSVIAEMEYM